MKRILITGADSYIGTSFEQYMAQWPDEYQIDTVDMIDGSWRDRDFAGYDSVFHVAGIAHHDSGRITEEREQLYYKINTDLTIETAQKAKEEGVTQFIFMSSIIVYGAGAKLGQTKVITKDTKPAPESVYGLSKLRAEEGLRALSDKCFQVCILRPPMIYGPGCKGNYPVLARAARKLPFFPNIQNQRSMLFVGNLCSFLKKAVQETSRGIYFPQNEEYVSTSDMVREIALANGKKILLTKIFNPILRLLSGRVGIVDKVFGDLVYERDLTAAYASDAAFSFRDSISITENGFRDERKR